MSTTSKPWVVSGPHILKKPNGDYDGEGWHVNRPLPREGNHSAREWVMSGRQVRMFRTERAAVTCCASLNRRK